MPNKAFGFCSRSSLAAPVFVTQKQERTIQNHPILHSLSSFFKIDSRMNAVAPKERTNMFLDRISMIGPSTDIHRKHAAIHCARTLQNAASYKRQLPSSLRPLWIVFTHPSDDCDESDLSDSEEVEDEIMYSLRESRWSSNPSLTTQSPFKSQKPLQKSASVDTAMTLPTRKQNYVDLKNMTFD
ncbi:hypothetical protein FisN_40Hu002 [Fistulifera solaris]|jgi:hypothetical protein|uniref:Uncharacterized protein n=1 Tax=Fistulifera solaris TaxID=1519565 RepID=A0A1Z5K6S4_FISSO|nr:hypothetical protein FisN_40Hu002 [Fistulifera solaris]|eukprot:GAX21947.1 hypothetical protein FisN_40Hu002 [Fistulifera solaris]